MNIISIGDIHGHYEWKNIDINKYDKIIFVGDYFDSFNIPFIKQRENFINLLELKDNNKNKIELLLGNHDFHYLTTSNDKYSGYQYDKSFIIKELLNPKLFNICYKYNNYLFSHAGISKTWCINNDIDLNNKNIDEQINDIFYFRPNSFEFIYKRNNNKYGDNIYQSPIWIRPYSLLNDKIDDYIQIVGHTHYENITFKDNVYFIDVLNSNISFLELFI